MERGAWCAMAETWLWVLMVLSALSLLTQWTYHVWTRYAAHGGRCTLCGDCRGTPATAETEADADRPASLVTTREMEELGAILRDSIQQAALLGVNVPGLVGDLVAPALRVPDIRVVTA